MERNSKHRIGREVRDNRLKERCIYFRLISLIFFHSPKFLLNVFFYSKSFFLPEIFSLDLDAAPNKPWKNSKDPSDYFNYCNYTEFS